MFTKDKETTIQEVRVEDGVLTMTLKAEVSEELQKDFEKGEWFCKELWADLQDMTDCVSALFEEARADLGYSAGLDV